jgi:hypothetical protein
VNPHNTVVPVWVRELSVWPGAFGRLKTSGIRKPPYLMETRLKGEWQWIGIGQFGIRQFGIKLEIRIQKSVKVKILR